MEEDLLFYNSTFGRQGFEKQMGMLHFKGGSAVKASPSPPPVTERKTEVIQAERDARRLVRNRRGYLASTILAGETGAGQAQQNGRVGVNRLLGGG